jgi:tryptophanyl-tRNA synthetase
MTNNNSKKRVFSGIQPSGKLHIGNYVGAITQWVAHQDIYDNIFCVVDLHALTIPENVTPAKLRGQSREVAGLLVACGIHPEKCAIFIQSYVPEHSELAWILNCVTPVGWLERMTQYKSKSEQMLSVGTGLLDYPVLQTADILLYKTDLVPVGEDQKQHVELTRDIAARFNRTFGEVFIVPEVVLRASGARIMAFDNPEQKMSKSIGEKKAGHSVGLLDDPDTVKRTMMSAVTDSGRETRFDFASPGVLNLLTLYQALTSESRQAIEEKFAGKGYGFLKRETLEVVLATIQPIQARYNEIMSDPSFIENILKRGVEQVRPIAQQTMERVRQVTGIG